MLRLVNSGGWEMKLGEKLKLARERAKLTQQNVADQLHVTRAAISNWETNRSKPDIELLTQLSQLYGQSLDAWTQLGQNETNVSVVWYRRPKTIKLIVVLIVLTVGAGFINQIYNIGYAVGKALAYWIDAR